MKVLAVYGTLKKGSYNHGYLLNAKYLGQSTVRGLMYLIGSYPGLVEPENALPGDEVREFDVELYEVDEHIHRGIRSMELGAGYYEKDIDFNVNGETITAGVYFKQRPEGERTWLTAFTKETVPGSFRELTY